MNKHLLLAKSPLTSAIFYGVLFASFLTLSPARCFSLEENSSWGFPLENDSSPATSMVPNQSGHDFTSIFNVALERVGNFTLSAVSSLKNTLGVIIEENEIEPLGTRISEGIASLYRDGTEQLRTSLQEQPLHTPRSIQTAPYSSEEILSQLIPSDPAESRTNAHLQRKLRSHHASISTRISKTGSKSELRSYRLGVGQNAFERF